MKLQGQAQIERETEMLNEIYDLRQERDQLRLRLLSAAGDDLCRLSQEEIKAYTSGAVQIPPKEEFIPSCERFHEQIAAGPGVLKGCLTLAQLIAENEKLLQRAEAAEAENAKLREVLQSIQHINMSGGQGCSAYPTCPVCGEHTRSFGGSGHTSDCKLAAALVPTPAKGR